MAAGAKKSRLVLKEKWTIPNGLVREMTLWEVPISSQYPAGIRYRMVLVNPLTGEVLVLFDNHSPKGHHQHIRGKELAYQFVSVSKLISDFLDLSRKWED